MNALTILIALIGTTIALATLPGTIELLALTIGGLLPSRSRRDNQKIDPLSLRMAVVVPAHNEARHIERCVRSLRACATHCDSFSVVVVADNCSDDTAERAANAGARVLLRHNEIDRGKGYALNFAFQTLLDEGVEAVAVVDADTVVEPNFIAELRRLLSEGADAVQCRYEVLNAGDSTRTRLMKIALTAFNVLRPRGRERWGLSVGLLGNGFVLTRETLLAVPYLAHSIVEDLEYHLRLVKAGRRVRFANDTAVYAEMPSGGQGAATQRARWDGGRFRMIVEHAPSLAREVAKGNWRMVEPLFELLLLPLAFHVSLLLAGLLLASSLGQAISIAGLAVVALHVVSAAIRAGAGIRDLAALGVAPLYILWKLSLTRSLLRAARHDAAWIRTERNLIN